MSEPLYRALQERASANGQSVRFVLESAVRHYLEVVVNSQETLQPAMIRCADETIREYDGALKKLAKA